MVSHGSLNNKSPQVFWTRLNILSDLNNVVVWMVSNRPIIFKSSSPCTNLLVTVPGALITIGIIVTFIFHSFFNSLVRLRYLALFSHSFNFTLWSAGTAKSTIRQVLFFYYHYLKNFHPSVSWLFFTGVWVIASFLKHPGLNLVFWPIWIMS